MTQLREATITKKILDHLKTLPGCYARKTIGGPYGAGWPDIVGCWHGRTLMLEVKTETGHVTPLQEAELCKWKRAGAISAVVRSVEDVQQLMEEFGIMNRETHVRA